MAFSRHAFLSRRSARRPWCLAPIPFALALASLQAGAQTAPGTAQQLPTVTVSDQSVLPSPDIAGFGDQPLSEVPVSATVIGRQQIQESGARRLADLTRFDASVSDAYNSPGYWDFLSIRGFVLDNRFNYRREGLPISAETSIPLENKERVEILKGTSGIQAGTSAPGGLVNYVVKRPPATDLREVRLEYTSRGSVLGAADLGGRFGADGAVGWRLNAAHEELKPLLANLDGHRDLLSLATDWRLSRDAVLSAEFEWSRKVQPSQQAFSILGNTLPAPPDPHLNLNNQPWSQPSRFDAATGTVRFDQALADGWRWSAQWGRQFLRSDDHLAYGFGCGAEGNYDRFCSDGTYDMYDFRSDGENRAITSGQLQLKGSVQTGNVKHDLAFGVLESRLKYRFGQQAYNYVGSGSVDGSIVNPADPTLTGENTNRDERSREFSASDAIRWTDRFSTWVGARVTSLDRQSVQTDGGQPTSYSATVTTPWLAASYKLQPGLMAYASWGEGIESQIVPNKVFVFDNPGQALAPLKSRQTEIGFKGESQTLSWQAAWFRIVRPMSNVDDCVNAGSPTLCTGQFDGEAVHQGLEGNVQWRSGAWQLGTGATVIDAKREGSAQSPQFNGLRPTNVPRWTLRANASYRVAQVPGLRLEGMVSHEAERAVTLDNSITLPAWTRVDVGARWERKLSGVNTSWFLGVQNVFDKRYWQESPTQYGHVYLFEGAPRTLRLTFTASL